MIELVTLALNPTIDISYEVETMAPTKKLRAYSERNETGGGGINVAKVFERLGGKVHCHYLSGGPTGLTLDGLLDREGLARTKIAIAGDTRVCSMVFERSTGLEYRVVPPGPAISEPEWHESLAVLGGVECPFLVLSGSLPGGVPDDYYARAAEIGRRHGAKIVLDSSGRGLAGGLAGGGIYLVKPNLIELESVVGGELVSEERIVEAARSVVERGMAENVAVTLGEGGALLVSAHTQFRLPAIPVPARSAVGAGDSFLAAMVFALARDWTIENAFRLGVAAGAAALMTPGTELAEAKDIMRLYASVPGK